MSTWWARFFVLRCVTAIRASLIPSYFGLPVVSKPFGVVFKRCVLRIRTVSKLHSSPPKMPGEGLLPYPMSVCRRLSYLQNSTTIICQYSVIFRLFVTHIASAPAPHVLCHPFFIPEVWTGHYKIAKDNEPNQLFGSFLRQINSSWNWEFGFWNFWDKILPYRIRRGVKLLLRKGLLRKAWNIGGH